MQPISEIPSQFVHRFAKLCSSDIRAEVEEMRPANLKDSARFLVEDVLSGFPDLVPTETLEVNAHCVARFDTVMVCDLTSASQEQIKRCGTAELVGYQLQWSVGSEKLLVVLDESQSQSTTTQDLVDVTSLQPMLLFFLNEILHANSRISLMKRNLVELDLILQGRISGDSGNGMTSIMNALAIGQVPEQWEARCKVPASSWISDFIAHVRALHIWAPEAVFASMPVFWLPHLRNSKALFAALQLVAAAKENVKIDHIQIEWEVSKKPYAAGQSTPFRSASVGSSASYCISFGGVSLIGAQWSPFTQVLEDCDPESVNQLPVICARAGFRAPAAGAPLHSGFSIGDYECPVYSDRTRSHLLFSMKLKSLVHTAKWAMIGVHAVLSSEVSQSPS
jgi:hypothetical protein